MQLQLEKKTIIVVALRVFIRLYHYYYLFMYFLLILFGFMHSWRCEITVRMLKMQMERVTEKSHSIDLEFQCCLTGSRLRTFAVSFVIFTAGTQKTWRTGTYHTSRQLIGFIVKRSGMVSCYRCILDSSDSHRLIPMLLEPLSFMYVPIVSLWK